MYELKEFHGATKPEVDFIYKLLNEAYNSGMKYDVSDMKPAIIAFAALRLIRLQHVLI